MSVQVHVFFCYIKSLLNKVVIVKNIELNSEKRESISGINLIRTGYVK